MSPRVKASERVRNLMQLLGDDIDAEIPTIHKAAFGWLKVCLQTEKADFLPFFVKLLEDFIDDARPTLEQPVLSKTCRSCCRLSGVLGLQADL